MLKQTKQRHRKQYGFNPLKSGLMLKQPFSATIIALRFNPLKSGLMLKRGQK